MSSLEKRYSEASIHLDQRMAVGIAEMAVDTKYEATVVAKLFDVARKRRSSSAYDDVADHLLNHYTAEVAYAVAVQINEQLEKRVGYPPIGQIMVALERHGGEGAARLIACSLRNFPRAEMARLAFGVFKSDAMRSLLRADLAAEDPELAEYICAGSTAISLRGAPGTQRNPSLQAQTISKQQGLSDGIERMPRRLTTADRRSDVLFRHLQILSNLSLLLFPILGGVMRGWAGMVIGLVIGWFTRTWMRRSMGLRGSNPDEGFFIRMRERAKGSHRGFLEILIESVRQRPFTRAQCIAITQVWDETHRRLAAVAPVEEKITLMNECDAQVKQILYGQDA